MSVSQQSQSGTAGNRGSTGVLPLFDCPWLGDVGALSDRAGIGGRPVDRDRRWQDDEALHGDAFEVIEHAIHAERNPIGVLIFARLFQLGGDLGQLGKPVTAAGPLS